MGNKQNTITIQQKQYQQLIIQLQPQQKLIKNNTQSCCQYCWQQFSVFFRKKHHCRSCGQLFCSQCSNYFVTNDNTHQKSVRFCKPCFDKVKKQQQTKQQKQYNKSHEQKKLSEKNKSRIPYENQSILQEKYSDSIEQQISEQLHKKATMIITKVAQSLCQMNNIDSKFWTCQLVTLAENVLKQFKFEMIASGQQMNISKKRVLVKVKVSDDSKAGQQIVKGIIIENILNYKSMLSLLCKKPLILQNPKILIFEDSIDYDTLSSTLNFQQLSKNQKSILTKIVQKIVKLNPKIIFVQNKIHLKFLQQFLNRQIFVFSQIDKDKIKIIKSISSVGKTIQKLWNLQRQSPSQILGKCDRIYFRSVNEGQIMIFMEAASKGVRTILLGLEEKDINQRKDLKQIMKILVKLSYHLKLEKYFITTEQQLKNAITTTTTNNNQSSIFPAMLNFTPIIYQNYYNNLENVPFHQQIKYSKISFYKTPNEQIKQICGEIEIDHRYLFAENIDLTLGTYLLMQDYLKPCKKCSNKHQQQYYLNGHIVSIQTNKINKSIEQDQIQIPQQQQSLKIITAHIKHKLKKNRDKYPIKVSIKCQNCRSKIGVDSVKVPYLYLSNSFFHILHIIVLAYSQTFKLGKKNANYVSSSNIQQESKQPEQCDHPILFRAYQCGNTEIKFLIRQAEPYTFDCIKFGSKQFFEHMKQKKNNYIHNTCQTQIEQMERMLYKTTTELFTFWEKPNEKFKKQREISENFRNVVKRWKKQWEDTKSSTRQQQLFGQILKMQNLCNTVIHIKKKMEKQFRKKSDHQILQSTNQSVLQLYQSDITQSIELQKIRNSSFFFQISSPTNKTQNDDEFDRYSKKTEKKLFAKVQNNNSFFPFVEYKDPISIVIASINIYINNKSNKKKEQQSTNQNIDSLHIEFNQKLTCMTKSELSDIAKIQNQCGVDFRQKPRQKFLDVNIRVPYPKNFKNIRQRYEISQQQYSQGLSTCKCWDSSGGKSNSLFAKAENDLLVVKIVSEKQFQEFGKFAKKYIQYVGNYKTKTYLVKIFGIYQIIIKGKMDKIHKCVVMQNLFFNLSNKIDKVYDLKGSQTNRFVYGQQNTAYTGHDTNFKKDKNSQPYLLKYQQYNSMIDTLSKDLQFLSKGCSVIDYSLLVIQIKAHKLRFGIIDYLRPYLTMEKIQNIYKEVKFLGNQPTVIPPDKYATRFIAAIKKYFLKIQ